MEREAKALAKERRQAQIEAEREKKKQAKAMEAVAKKAELEERRMDRVYKKLEEKVIGVGRDADGRGGGQWRDVLRR